MNDDVNEYWNDEVGTSHQLHDPVSADDPAAELARELAGYMDEIDRVVDEQISDTDLDAMLAQIIQAATPFPETSPPESSSTAKTKSTVPRDDAYTDCAEGVYVALSQPAAPSPVDLTKRVGVGPLQAHEIDSAVTEAVEEYVSLALAGASDRVGTVLQETERLYRDALGKAEEMRSDFQRQLTEAGRACAAAEERARQAEQATDRLGALITSLSEQVRTLTHQVQVMRVQAESSAAARPSPEEPRESVWGEWNAPSTRSPYVRPVGNSPKNPSDAAQRSIGMIFDGTYTYGEGALTGPSLPGAVGRHRRGINRSRGRRSSSSAVQGEPVFGEPSETDVFLGERRHRRAKGARTRLLTTGPVAGEVDFNRFPPGNCSILTADIADFSRRGTSEQEGARRALYLCLRKALEMALISWDACYHEDRGDGLLLAIPPSIPGRRILDQVFPGLGSEVRRYNLTVREHSRIRVRLGGHLGPEWDAMSDIPDEAIALVSVLMKSAEPSQGAATGSSPVSFMASDLFFHHIVPWELQAEFKHIELGTGDNGPLIGWRYAPTSQGENAVSPREVGPARHSPTSLTAAQIRILDAIASGVPVPQAAAQLELTPGGLRREVRSICDHLQVRTPIEAVVWAVRRNLLGTNAGLGTSELERDLLDQTQTRCDIA
ncbi:helix-turn-helix transcriptional regulator [Actinomadura macra]|uniref:helix-turn-helix transcriptional regulator n=1 Tax=Actinomadura macra TaxID=46164 RepID=UPI00082FA3AB|nr:hypothetical protein [Actinomadura macra]